MGVKDDRENVVTVEGPVPEDARNKPLTPEGVGKSSSPAPAGPPTAARGCARWWTRGSPSPAAALNALRREALEGLSARRMAPPGSRRKGPFQPGVRYENRREPPVLTVSVSRAEQVTKELCALGPALIYVPAEELAAHPELAGRGPLAVQLPRIAWDREWETLKEQLRRAREMGVQDALVGNLGMLELAREMGFTLRGDFGLEIFNSRPSRSCGIWDSSRRRCPSSSSWPRSGTCPRRWAPRFITYGRLPLMIMENCILRNRTGGVCRHACERGENLLTDRKGARFPVVRAFGCRNEILNSKTLFLGDKQADVRRAGAWAQRLMFTTESPPSASGRWNAIWVGATGSPGSIPGASHYRDVE